MKEQQPSAGAQRPGPPTQEDKQPSTDALQGARPLRRRRTVVIPILLLMLAAVFGAGYWYVKIRGVIATDDAYIAGDRVSVSTKMLGRIVELGADEGDTVQRGELLVRLDDADLRAQESQAQASLTLAQENVQVSAVEVQGLRDDLERAAEQLGWGGITQERYDHAKTALDLAEARQRVALAQVQTARAQLQVIETQLENTRIDAPLTGVVARRWVLPGDVVQPGQPIFAIYDLADLWVTANFEETKIGQIHAGDRVMISVDAYPDHELTGTLLWIGAAAASQFSLIPPNNASGNFTKVTQRVPVRISIDRPELGTQDPLVLVPGLSVEVSIKVREQ
jgi:membrane fusion protein (multidrug efflux system)